MGSAGKVSRLFKEEQDLQHKEVLFLKELLRLIEEDEAHLKRGDVFTLFSHRHRIFELLLNEENLEPKMSRIILALEAYADKHRSQKHQVLAGQVRSSLAKFRDLDSKRGVLENLVREIQALVGEFQKGKTFAKDAIVVKMEQAVGIVKASLSGLSTLKDLLDKLLVVDIEVARQDDEATMDYFRHALTRMYHADQAIRAMPDEGPSGLPAKMYNLITGALSGEYRSMNAIHVDQYNQVRLAKLLEIHPLNTITETKLMHMIFYIIQHADRNLAFQLKLAKDFLRNPHASPKDKAYLIDRISCAQKKPQWFGIQNEYPGDVYAMKNIKGAEVAEVLHDSRGNPYGELTEASKALVSSRLHKYGLPSVEEQYQSTVKRTRIEKQGKKAGKVLMFLNVDLK